LAVEKKLVQSLIQSHVDEMGINPGIDIYLQKGLPLVLGMGSSAASAVAALVLQNENLGKSFREKKSYFLLRLLLLKKVAWEASCHCR